MFDVVERHYVDKVRIFQMLRLQVDFYTASRVLRYITPLLCFVS